MVGGGRSRERGGLGPQGAPKSGKTGNFRNFRAFPAHGFGIFWRVLRGLCGKFPTK